MKELKEKIQKYSAELKEQYYNTSIRPAYDHDFDIFRSIKLSAIKERLVVVELMGCWIERIEKIKREEEKNANPD